MSLTFANFKQIIPSQILTRGRDYYRNQQISDLTMDEEGLWLAQVEGTETYEVTIEQDPDGILTCSCTCPYDMGEYCKHIAAALYAIEDNFPESIVGKSKRHSTTRRATKHDKLRRALEAIPKDKLIDGLLELAAQDRQILNQLLIRFDATGEKASDYKAVVNEALRSGRGEYGFIDYHGAMRAAKKLYDLMQQAKRMAAEGQPDRAAAIYQAVLENTAAVMNKIDDSSGEPGGVIETAFSELSECAKQLGPKGRASLFAYCLEQAVQEKYQAFSWDWDWFKLAADLVETDNQRDSLMGVLGNRGRSKRQDTFYRNYYAEQTAVLQLKMINHLDGKEAGETFIAANLHFDAIRQSAIREYIAQGRLADAKTLIQGGIDIHKNKNHNLLREYQTLLLQLALAQHDKPTIIEQARSLWLSHFATEEHYALLKKNVPANEWDAFLAKLVIDMRGMIEKLAWVYAREGLWDRLLPLTREHEIGIHILPHYQGELEKRFPNEVATIYEQQIKLMVTKGSANRSTYQKIADYLTRMKRLGKAAAVDAIISDLRAKYPQRRALLDELKQV
jgi:uncharacterized Zn finger protein